MAEAIEERTDVLARTARTWLTRLRACFTDGAPGSGPIFPQTSVGQTPRAGSCALFDVALPRALQRILGPLCLTRNSRNLPARPLSHPLPHRRRTAQLLATDNRPSEGLPARPQRYPRGDRAGSFRAG